MAYMLLIVSRWTKYNTLFSFGSIGNSLTIPQTSCREDERPTLTAVICLHSLMTVLFPVLYWCHFAAYKASFFLCTGSTPHVEHSCKGLILKGGKREGGDRAGWRGSGKWMAGHIVKRGAAREGGRHLKLDVEVRVEQQADQENPGELSLVSWSHPVESLI